jgi:uncharacterized Zn finger protein
MTWSERFLESLGLRGHLVAGPDQVSGLTVAAGSITAQVQGSRRKPYDVWIDLPVFSPAEWARAERAMASDPSCYELILDGDLPPGLEDLFAGCGLSLLPAKVQDLTMDCSCPDWAVPCKHVTEVLWLLAKAFDADPFDVLTWRGRTRSRLLEHLHDLRKSAAIAAEPRPAVNAPVAELPLAECLDDFWQGGRDQPSEPPRQPADPALDRLDPPDLVIRGRNLADLLGPAYKAFSSW